MLLVGQKPMDLIEGGPLINITSIWNPMSTLTLRPKIEVVGPKYLKHINPESLRVSMALRTMILSVTHMDPVPSVKFTWKLIEDHI